MQRRTDFLLLWAGLFLIIALPAASLGQVKEEGGSSYAGMQREQLVKELNLAPNKAREFLGVNAKYDQSRQQIIERIQKNESELEKALAAPRPDGGKIKKLVSALTADHDKLFQTFKAQRQKEMALLNPVQQARFLIALKKWHEEMREEYEKNEKED